MFLDTAGIFDRSRLTRQNKAESSLPLNGDPSMQLNTIIPDKSYWCKLHPLNHKLHHQISFRSYKFNLGCNFFDWQKENFINLWKCITKIKRNLRNSITAEKLGCN